MKDCRDSYWTCKSLACGGYTHKIPATSLDAGSSLVGYALGKVYELPLCISLLWLKLPVGDGMYAQLSPAEPFLCDLPGLDVNAGPE